MKKYHGTPLTPNSILIKALTGYKALIPFPRPENLKTCLKICSSICIDNGAFSVWRKGISIDWNDYYEWLAPIVPNPKVDFFLIPDVIDGTEKENDELIVNYNRNHRNKLLNKGVPIWHVNESLERLERLSKQFDYIAFGSAGEYSTLGTPKWHKKITKAFNVICDENGYPRTKIHMLRCLDSKIFTKYPFYSGDSTSLAQNHKITTKRGLTQKTKLFEIEEVSNWKKVRDRLERFNSPKKLPLSNYKQTSLF